MTLLYLLNGDCGRLRRVIMRIVQLEGDGRRLLFDVVGVVVTILVMYMNWLRGLASCRVPVGRSLVVWGVCLCGCLGRYGFACLVCGVRRGKRWFLFFWN